MTAKLGRFYRDQQRRADQQKIAKILLETGVAAPQPGNTSGSLRGVPAVGRGVPGTMPGTDPAVDSLRDPGGKRRQEDMPSGTSPSSSRQQLSPPQHTEVRHV